MDKHEALEKLVRKRRSLTMPGYSNLHEVAGGIYDCEYVSPWSKCAHNVDSPIFIAGQDWSSEGQFEDRLNHASMELGYDPTKRTNINLQNWLLEHFGLAFSDVYATNAFPFIKPGSMQGSVPQKDMDTAVEEFLLPQIEVVRPLMVVCLGLLVFNGVRNALKMPSIRPLDAAMGAPIDYCGSRIVVVAHTGSRGTNNRGYAKACDDWAALRRQFDALRARRH
jgi:restriction system protein